MKSVRKPFVSLFVLAVCDKAPQLVIDAARLDREHSLANDEMNSRINEQLN